MIRRPPRSTQSRSSAASDVYKRQELHVHLEGTIRRETAVTMSVQNGLPEPPPYEYSDLAGFLAVYGLVSGCMVTRHDFERVIFEHGEAMASQHITYAEISFNPSLHV